MISIIVGAIKIATLVTLGGAFMLWLPDIVEFLKGEYKTMDKKEVKSKVMKWIGGFVFILGLAFEGGAFLAHVQGILLQIVPLAVTGAVCMIAGIGCFIAGKMK